MKIFPQSVHVLFQYVQFFYYHRRIFVAGTEYLRLSKSATAVRSTEDLGRLIGGENYQHMSVALEISVIIHWVSCELDT